MEEVACEICGVNETKNIISTDKFNIVQCKRCGLVYMNPRPDEAWMNKYYEDYSSNLNIFFKEERLYKLRFNERLDEIERFKRGGILLDTGCSVGYFLELAKKRGWQVSGVEFSPKSADVARRNAEVLVGLIEEIDLKSESYDVITMWHLIEHLRYPSKVLEKVRRALRQEGLLAIETPNIDYYLRFKSTKLSYVLGREHLYNFSSSTLKRLLENAGFTILKLETRPSGTGSGEILRKLGIKDYFVKHLPFLSFIRNSLTHFRSLVGQNEIIIAYAKK